MNRSTHVALLVSLYLLTSAGCSNTPAANKGLQCADSGVSAEVRDLCLGAQVSNAKMSSLYENVLGKLNGPEREALIADQRSWIEDLDGACGWFGGNTRIGGTPFPSDAQDYECLQYQYSTREMILRSRTPGLVRSGVEGTYRREYGEGQLEICNQVGSHVEYQIDVLMGNSSGSLGGLILIAADGLTATDRDFHQADGSTGGEAVATPADQATADGDHDEAESDECRVEFSISPLEIQVGTSGCDGYRGVGASFDGPYYLLTPQRGDALVKDPSDHGGMCGAD